MNMRLLGTPTINDLGPHLVDAGSVHMHVVSVPDDRLYNVNCTCAEFERVSFLFLLMYVFFVTFL
jgi:hypothetical protein